MLELKPVESYVYLLHFKPWYCIELSIDNMNCIKLVFELICGINRPRNKKNNN